MTEEELNPPARHSLWNKKYSIVLIDCPWSYYGSGTKNAAAAKHYSLMTDADIKALPIKSILEKNAFVFVWATCPKLDLAIEAIKAWKLHYRGVAHIWAKANKQGKLIHGQGVPPTYSKPTTELLLVATTKKSGRPLKLLSSALPQVVLEPRSPKGHSAKPNRFHQLIDSAFEAKHNRIEIFARRPYTGWDVIGNGIDGVDIRETLRLMTEK